MHSLSTKQLGGPRSVFNMFTYEMPKLIRVKHRTIAVINRILQLGIIGYFFVFIMWWECGYQKTETALSGVMSVVTGVAYTEVHDDPKGPLVMDSAEYLLGHLQCNSFFIVTRISNVTEQRYAICPEARDLEDAYCNSDVHCAPGYVAGQSMESPTNYLPPSWVTDLEADAHGVFTGACNQRLHVCEIYGWCPVEEDIDSLHAGSLRPVAEERNQIIKQIRTNEEVEIPHLEEDDNEDIIQPMKGVLNFTVFIKNIIEFSEFDVKLENILPWMTVDYLKNCLFQPNHPRDRYCPNFKVENILESAGSDKNRLLRYGGVIAITIDWNCNLDWSIDRCLPSYSFVQLDFSDEEGSACECDGWPMEVARRSGAVTRTRELSKINGIQFLVQVTGKAGKFSWFVFTMQFGANLSLLGLASLICDFCLFKLTRKRNLYRGVAHSQIR